MLASQFKDLGSVFGETDGGLVPDWLVLMNGDASSTHKAIKIYFFGHRSVSSCAGDARFRMDARADARSDARRIQGASATSAAPFGIDRR